MAKLTSKEQQALRIHDTPAQGKNISFKAKTLAQLTLYWEKYIDRYPNFSSIIEDAAWCLLEHGPDWRAGVKREDDIITAIREEISKLKVIRAAGDPLALGDATNDLLKKFDDEEGFFTE